MSEKKVALDLFSGTGSATKAFQESEDWKVFRIEKNPNIVKEYGAELHADILDIGPEDLPIPDFIWASPPCTDFSVACMANKWSKKGLPKVKSISKSVKLVYHTLWLIHELNPDYWFLENPRGKMRKIVPESLNQYRHTITYCQYGDNRMKPTDLWGVHPSSFNYKMCSPNDSCHVHSPRGSNTGTQALSGNTERSKVPYGLSKEILESVDNPGRKTKQKRLFFE